MIPQQPPGPSLAQAILDAFQAYLDKVEEELVQKQTRQQHLDETQAVHQIFKATRPTRPEPVESLCTTHAAKVASIEEDDSFCFDPSLPLDPARPFVGPQGVHATRGGPGWTSMGRTTS